MAHIFSGVPKFIGTVRITRSFSYKLNVGQYESRDFFMSQQTECTPEDAEEISEQVYQFCKSQVMKSVRSYVNETMAQFGPQSEKKRSA